MLIRWRVNTTRFGALSYCSDYPPVRKKHSNSRHLRYGKSDREMADFVGATRWLELPRPKKGGFAMMGDRVCGRRSSR